MHAHAHAHTHTHTHTHARTHTHTHTHTHTQYCYYTTGLPKSGMVSESGRSIEARMLLTREDSGPKSRLRSAAVLAWVG